MAPRLRELRSVWLVYDEALQVGCQQEPLDKPLVWEAQCVINNWINQMSVGTATPDSAQYSAVKYTWARVAVRRTEAPAPQVVPASRLIDETQVLSFLQSDSKCCENGSSLPFNSTESSHFASLMVRWNTDDTVFVSLSFSLHF